MDIVKIGIALIVIFAFMGFSWGDEAWIKESSSNLGMTQLTAVIHIHIKNTNSHMEFFKISQQYFQVSPTLNWTVDWTDPPAIRMAKNVNPELGGDLGWEIEAGQTREITFKLRANGGLGSIPGYITLNSSTSNQFWPLIPEPGLAASWFLPNEIEYLNPNLDLQLWQGKFTFLLTNHNTNYPRVEGLVRAPIIPINSQLISSSPSVDYVDSQASFAKTAVWDVTLYPGQSRYYTYTYQWPSTSSATSVSSVASPVSTIPTTIANSRTTTPVSVPTKDTGVPYGLLGVAVLIIAVGVVYVKFLR
jgi:hypothetical protein